MDLKLVLNPWRGDQDGYCNSHSPPHISCQVAAIPSSHQQKVPKDAPIFSEGNRPIGIINFPPHEAMDNQKLMDHHRGFSVYPLGEIQKKGVRHIPYNSDKKDFLHKTGRTAFEVFQYTYKRPGEDKEYTVVWDYNVGLVRMTPFFKSCKYTKTIPAKALRENPGLKEISYSITGGALVCQGYWMPYEAARAIAATFCYEIRWALTPIFGNKFPSECLRPEDPSFANFRIDPAIVRHCVEETNRFRKEGPSYDISMSIASLPTETPNSDVKSPPSSVKGSKQRLLRPADVESGYGTDTEGSYKYLMSPEVSPRSQPLSPHGQFTPVNGPLSPCSPRTPYFSSMYSSMTDSTAQALLSAGVTSPAIVQYCSKSLRAKRTHSKVTLTDHAQKETLTCPRTRDRPLRFDSAQGSDDSVSGQGYTSQEMHAASVLLSFSAGDKLPPTKRTRCGSQC